MDGFAVRAADATAGVILPIVDTIAAGRPPAHQLRPGEAMRIMTGAMLPEGADAVVPVEETALIGSDRVEFTRQTAVGANIRDAGADVSAGTVVLETGRELSPADLGLLAALGVPSVAVGSRPRVTILSTGDELLDVDQPLTPGAIRDSNAIQLRLLVEEAGCRVIHGSKLSDDPKVVLAAIREHAARSDVLLTIGGVSMGEFDPVKQSLGELQGVAWWRVAMKPGQPQVFGTLGSAVYFGLPGNPASVACVFEVLVHPALRALQGFSTLDRPRISVRSRERVESRAGRTDFVRAVLERHDGTWWATPAGAQISGHLVPQSRAHVLVIVPESAASLNTGDPAEAILLRWPDAPTE
jgi:molybdopterin molybdotransferase